MKKGFYFIATAQKDKEDNPFHAPELIEGSYEYHGKLFVHRTNGVYGNHSWKVSHTKSGTQIVNSLPLWKARKLAKELQGYELWNIGTFDELHEAKENPKYNRDFIKIKEAIKEANQWR